MIIVSFLTRINACVQNSEPEPITLDVEVDGAMVVVKLSARATVSDLVDELEYREISVRNAIVYYGGTTLPLTVARPSFCRFPVRHSGCSTPSSWVADSAL